MIGLCGSHRVGKTSLARTFAEKRGLKFVETSASAIFKELGYDPAVTYDFSTRLLIQEEILKRFDRLYSQHVRADLSITDRTPLDMLAYTMAEAVGNAVSAKDQERFRQYARNCIEITNKRFTVLVVVQPGIKVVAEEGKAALNDAYIEHLNSVILGLSVDERIKPTHFYLPRQMTDMDERIAALDFAIGRAKQRAEREMEGAILH
jgi:AAA+ ATPase superfamily predicted ATPase